MKKKQIRWIVGFIALVLWLCLGIYNYERKKNLLENGIETIGVVEKVTMYRGRFFFDNPNANQQDIFNFAKLLKLLFNY